MAPILDEHALEFISHSPEQTRRLGAHVGALLQGGDTVCLEGALGSGKTCFAQGIGRGWGVTQPLISPSYVLIREYQRPPSPVTLFHVDLYRLTDLDEAYSLGLDEFLGDRQAISVIEWAARARALMPVEHLWIKLDPAGNTRRLISFVAQGERHLELLRQFRRTAFGV